MQSEYSNKTRCIILSQQMGSWKEQQIEQLFRVSSSYKSNNYKTEVFRGASMTTNRFEPHQEPAVQLQRAQEAHLWRTEHAIQPARMSEHPFPKRAILDECGFLVRCADFVFRRCTLGERCPLLHWCPIARQHRDGIAAAQPPPVELGVDNWYPFPFSSFSCHWFVLLHLLCVLKRVASGSRSNIYINYLCSVSVPAPGVCVCVCECVC